MGKYSYNMIRTIIIVIVCICCALTYTSSAVAGQYLKINKIDASSEFPKVIISVTINGIDSSSGALSDNDLIIDEDGSRIEEPLTVINDADSENHLYLVFSIDSSKSISKNFLKKIKMSARDIAGSIGEKDKIAVYRFNDNVELLNSFSHNTDEILKNIDGIKRHGRKTLLYTSIYDSIELLDKVRLNNKKVIVFTDGKDEGSSVDEEDVIQFAANAMIPIYFICCKDSKNIRSMARISKRTGGALLYSTGNDIAGMYRTVISVMKNRYTVSYPTKLNLDGMNHRIEVRLKHKNMRDRDSEVFFLEKKQSGGPIIPNSAIIVLNIVLLVILVAVICFFIYREKELLKKMAEDSQRPVPGHDEPASFVPVEEAGIAFNKSGSGAWLLQKNGSAIGKKYPIQYPDIIIGSGKESTIIINDTSVSERHSRIKNIQGAYTLFDLISDRGTYLNDKKLLRPKVLHDWDEITIGSTKLIFRASPLRSE